MSENLCKCKQCQRKFDDIEKELAGSSGKCIFHCEKNNWEKENINYFWKELRKYTSVIDKYDGKTLDNSIPYFSSLISKTYAFNKFIFPEFDKINRLSSSEIKNFFNTEEKIFEKDVDFSEAIFLDDAGFYSVQFNGRVIFSKTEFRKDVDFVEAKFNKEVYFLDITLTNKNINFIRSKYLDKLTIRNINSGSYLSIEMGECEFNKAEFDNLSVNNLLLKNSKFNKEVNFNSIEINDNMDLTNVKFFDSTSFNKSKFLNIINFDSTVFYSSASFIKTKFNLLDLKYCSFIGNTNFLNANSSFTSEYKGLKIKNRETARIIKNSFEQQNNIIEANKFYALEMKEREKELEKDKKNGKNLFEWLVFKIHGITSNHSQNWNLALFWIVIVGILTSLFNFYIMKDNEVFIHANFWTIFGTIFFTMLIFFCNSLNKWIQLGFFYLLYIYKTNDIFLFYVVKVINPFQKITDVNLIDFISKVIIAYLIYQFVVSIRQNTRRK